VETTEQVATSSQPATTTTTTSEGTTQELEKRSSFLGYRPGFEATAEEPATNTHSLESTATGVLLRRGSAGRPRGGRGRVFLVLGIMRVLP